MARKTKLSICTLDELPEMRPNFALYKIETFALRFPRRSTTLRAMCICIHYSDDNQTDRPRYSVHSNRPHLVSAVMRPKNQCSIEATFVEST